MESLLHTLHRGLGLFIPFLICLSATAQKSEAAAVSTQQINQVARVPGLGSWLHGVNAGVSFSGVHDSAIGWYELATPGVGYTLSNHYSLDASTPIYMNRLVERQTAGSGGSDRLVLDVGDVGDTSINFHAAYQPRLFYDVATASLTAPTGNRSAGLGTGDVTYSFDNMMEHYAHQVGFLLDLGLGDSSNLANNLVDHTYSSQGVLAHFQTGTTFWVLGRPYMQAFAYEELPLGSQTVYRIEGAPGGPTGPGGSTSNVVTSTSASEDNGFIAQAGIPFTEHLTLSGYYNRSLRHHEDTVAVGMTFVLRSTRGVKPLSMIDRALRVAAGLEDK